MTPSGKDGPRETAAGLQQGERGEKPRPAHDIHQDEMQPGLVATGTPQDVTSARAKNQRKGKVTADNWNQ